ncbi:site-specific DNA-methyltransferase [Motilimonas eburnea]|nr:DNA methyltransferase [Motilimonas eburnea]MCE2571688.1 site-specific DNA-methyltransferase [Motilimonas eburnea]
MDVAKELGVAYVGTDLHQGFNLLTDSLADEVAKHYQTKANLVFWHPPYADMIKYSGNMYGEVNPYDLSQMGIETFGQFVQVALFNIYDALQDGGVYGVLIGNMRRKGRYYNLSSMIERLAPGVLIDEIIKTQHNNVSDSRQYTGNIVRIMHEKLLVFRKEKSVTPIAPMRKRLEKHAENLVRSTIYASCLGRKRVELIQLYALVEPFGYMQEDVNIIVDEEVKARRLAITNQQQIYIP